MSKNNNVNPDHYKTAGRERQSEHSLHSDAPNHLGEHREGQTGTRNFIPGAAPVGESNQKSPGKGRRKS